MIGSLSLRLRMRSLPRCESGNPQVCPNQFQPGFTAWGSFAEQVAINFADMNLPVALPEWPDSAHRGLPGLPLCDLLSRGRRSRAREGEASGFAVHGCGGVGLSAIMIANALGAKVIAIDLGEEKLACARAMGRARRSMRGRSRDAGRSPRNQQGRRACLDPMRSDIRRPA